MFNNLTDKRVVYPFKTFTLRSRLLIYRTLQARIVFRLPAGTYTGMTAASSRLKLMLTALSGANATVQLQVKQPGTGNDKTYTTNVWLVTEDTYNGSLSYILVNSLLSFPVLYLKLLLDLSCLVVLQESPALYLYTSQYKGDLKGKNPYWYVKTGDPVQLIGNTSQTTYNLNDGYNCGITLDNNDLQILVRLRAGTGQVQTIPDTTGSTPPVTVPTKFKTVNGLSGAITIKGSDSLGVYTAVETDNAGNVTKINVTIANPKKTV